MNPTTKKVYLFSQQRVRKIISQFISTQQGKRSQGIYKKDLCSVVLYSIQSSNLYFYISLPKPNGNFITTLCLEYSKYSMMEFPQNSKKKKSLY